MSLRIEIRSSWIRQAGPKSNDQCSCKKKTKGYLKQKRRKPKPKNVYNEPGISYRINQYRKIPNNKRSQQTKNILTIKSNNDCTELKYMCKIQKFIMLITIIKPPFYRLLEHKFITLQIKISSIQFAISERTVFQDSLY